MKNIMNRIIDINEKLLLLNMHSLKKDTNSEAVECLKNINEQVEILSTNLLAFSEYDLEKIGQIDNGLFDIDYSLDLEALRKVLEQLRQLTALNLCA